MVDKILADNMKQVEVYRGGKTKLQGFFVGQVEPYLDLVMMFSLCWYMEVLPGQG